MFLKSCIGTLKRRAAGEGLSLSDFVLREMEQVAERPTMKELAARIASQTPVKYKVSPAEIIREERDRPCLRSCTSHVNA